MYDICVFAGRFRPFHTGHLHVVSEALKTAQYLFIIVGSVGEPLNFRNPFSFEEVREMIRASLSPLDADRVFICSVEDYDTDIKWVERVQQVVDEQVARLPLGREPSISLIGYSKDESSYYLRLFPAWGCTNVTPAQELSATTLREALYSSDKPSFTVQFMFDAEWIPRGTYYLLREWINSSEFQRLRDEYIFMRDYLAQFDNRPYPRNFNTADACVIQSGYVLLVRRGEMPGAGLWALPGGHVQQHERFVDAAIRELCEETQIDREIPREILKLAIRGEKLMDDPYRSTRKRTVSVAYGINLSNNTLPFVEGADDASEARWWKLNDVTRSIMFEDHFQIIEYFKNKFQD